MVVWVQMKNFLFHCRKNELQFENTHSEVFYEKVIAKSVAKFARNCGVLGFIKIETLINVFYCEFAKFFRAVYFCRTSPCNYFYSTELEITLFITTNCAYAWSQILCELISKRFVLYARYINCFFLVHSQQANTCSKL